MKELFNLFFLVINLLADTFFNFIMMTFVDSFVCNFDNVTYLNFKFKNHLFLY
jgi:hypothetical protein